MSTQTKSPTLNKLKSHLESIHDPKKQGVLGWEQLKELSNSYEDILSWCLDNMPEERRGTEILEILTRMGQLCTSYKELFRKFRCGGQNTKRELDLLYYETLAHLHHSVSVYSKRIGCWEHFSRHHMDCAGESYGRAYYTLLTLPDHLLNDPKRYSLSRSYAIFKWHKEEWSKAFEIIDQYISPPGGWPAEMMAQSVQDHIKAMEQLKRDFDSDVEYLARFGQ